KTKLKASKMDHKRKKTENNVEWRKEYIEQKIIKCRIAKSSEHGSDHHPIEIILNLYPCPYGPEGRRPYNYSKTDWKIFKEKLENYLPTLNPHTPTLQTVARLATDISHAIRRAT